MTAEPRMLDAEDPAHLVEAARMVRAGHVVVLPTDTGYGVAAGVFHPASVERVYAVKQRAPALRLPVLISTAADLPLLTRDVPAAAWRLIGRFWPGPLTVVLPAKPSVPKPITGGLGTVGVRVPNCRATLQVLEFLGEPVTGTSANISGQPPALTADEVVRQLGGSVDAVLVNDSALLHSTASSVVELIDGTVTVHREGALSPETLRGALSSRFSDPKLIKGQIRR